LRVYPHAAGFRSAGGGQSPGYRYPDGGYWTREVVSESIRQKKYWGQLVDYFQHRGPQPLTWLPRQEGSRASERTAC
jgi:hypothetical protein